MKINEHSNTMVTTSLQERYNSSPRILIYARHLVKGCADAIWRSQSEVADRHPNSGAFGGLKPCQICIADVVFPVIFEPLLRSCNTFRADPCLAGRQFALSGGGRWKHAAGEPALEDEDRAEIGSIVTSEDGVLAS